MDYPVIGTKVKFCRQNVQTHEVETGSGTVLAICMDQNKRLVAHIQPDFPEGTEQPSKFNVDLNCLNPTDEFIQKFTDVTAEIKRLTDEGNEKVKQIVADYEGIISGKYTEILGSPVEF